MFDGLLSQASNQGKKQLVAESPNRLHQLWQTKLLTYQQADQQLKNLIPELKLMYQTNQYRPTVKYYVGMAGIQSALSLSLSSQTESAALAWEIRKKMKLIWPTIRSGTKNLTLCCKKRRLSCATFWSAPKPIWNFKRYTRCIPSD